MVLFRRGLEKGEVKGEPGTLKLVVPFKKGDQLIRSSGLVDERQKEKKNKKRGCEEGIASKSIRSWGRGGGGGGESKLTEKIKSGGKKKVPAPEVWKVSGVPPSSGRKPK